MLGLNSVSKVAHRCVFILLTEGSHDHQMLVELLILGQCLLYSDHRSIRQLVFDDHGSLLSKVNITNVHSVTTSKLIKTSATFYTSKFYHGEIMAEHSDLLTCYATGLAKYMDDGLRELVNCLCMVNLSAK